MKKLTTVLATSACDVKMMPPTKMPAMQLDDNEFQLQNPLTHTQK
jgi:hypothetical protein